MSEKGGPVNPQHPIENGHVFVQANARPGQLVDPAINAVLQRDIVLQVSEHGVSNWAETARIDCTEVDNAPGGKHRSYFLKMLSDRNAAPRVYGEYTSMKEISDTLPSAAPIPRGYGRCHSKPNTHFYICDFIATTNALPDPARLGKKLAKLHHKSQSPNGMFGFYCPTYDGAQVVNNTWTLSWTAFFKRRIHEAYIFDLQKNGYWQLYEDVVKIALDHLIPRLLDALTEDGRAIKPGLIHGDLWESNIGTDKKTGEICFWDACA